QQYFVISGSTLPPSGPTRKVDLIRSSPAAAGRYQNSHRRLQDTRSSARGNVRFSRGFLWMADVWRGSFQVAAIEPGRKVDDHAPGHDQRSNQCLSLLIDEIVRHHLQR